MFDSREEAVKALAADIKAAVPEWPRKSVDYKHGLYYVHTRIGDNGFSSVSTDPGIACDDLRRRIATWKRLADQTR